MQQGAWPVAGHGEATLVIGPNLAASRNQPGDTGMTPERWQQIRDLLEEALELAPAERRAARSLLRRRCRAAPGSRSSAGFERRCALH